MRRVAIAMAVVAAGGGSVALAAAATAPKPVKAKDATGDVKSTLDITRTELSRSSDGRLRATVTLAAAWEDDALTAKSGPPGSVCLKVWATSVPPDAPPDYLVCATDDEDGKLRGSVLHERGNKLPERAASAKVSRPSTRSIALSFSQSSIGKPATLRVAAETTRPGCPRVSCIDTAPDAPATLTFKLRDS